MRRMQESQQVNPSDEEDDDNDDDEQRTSWETKIRAVDQDIAKTIGACQAGSSLKFVSPCAEVHGAVTQANLRERDANTVCALA